MFESYFTRIAEILQQVRDTQAEPIRLAAGKIADTIASKGTLYAFGCNHANLLAKELVFRTGGLAVINLIESPGLDLDVRPITLTTDLERLDGLGAVLVRAAGLKSGDLLIVHSVSGRNSVAIDAARQARSLGASVICLTNLAYSKSVSSRHPSGLHLYEVANIVLDNCGDIGDAVVELQGLGQKVGASSTAVGAAILNAVVVEAVARLIERGIEPPVFVSANTEGGDAHNARILAAYKDQIKYL